MESEKVDRAHKENGKNVMSCVDNLGHISFGEEAGLQTKENALKEIGRISRNNEYRKTFEKKTRAENLVNAGGLVTGSKGRKMYNSE